MLEATEELLEVGLYERTPEQLDFHVNLLAVSALAGPCSGVPFWGHFRQAKSDPILLAMLIEADPV